MFAVTANCHRLGVSSRCTQLHQRRLSGKQLQRAHSNGTKVSAFFNFNKNKASQSTVDTLSREDFGIQEVEDYFNYMGMLASEGTYDRMEAMLATGKAPVDLLLLMSCSENDAPKVEELLAAGADPTVKDLNGKSPLELCTKEEVREMVEAALRRLG